MQSVQNRILYEDNHLIICNKLCGELVQGDYTGDTPLLEKVREYIRLEYDKPGNVYCGLIHRLDRPTSGAVAFAKTSKALSRMNAVFESREVKKKYWALVREQAVPAEGRLMNYLRKDEKKNRSQVVEKTSAGAKKAVLNYRTLGKSDTYYLLEIDLETGRHHQIRVQLAHQGWPVKGDLKYGFSRSNKDAGISLHARTLDFIHPISKEPLSIIAPCPPGDKVWQFFESNPDIST